MVYYRWLHSTPCVKHASFLKGVDAFMPKLYRNRVIPCQNAYTVRQAVDCTTTLPLEVFRQWNDLRWWLAGKPMANFLFTLMNFLHHLLWFPSLWGEMYTAWQFSQGVNFFAFKFYLDGVVPHQPLLATENQRQVRQLSQLVHIPTCRSP